MKRYIEKPEKCPNCDNTLCVGLSQEKIKEKPGYTYYMWKCFNCGYVIKDVDDIASSPTIKSFIDKEPGTMRRLEQIREAISRGLGHFENKNKVVDLDLASAIFDEIVSLLETDRGSTKTKDKKQTRECPVCHIRSTVWKTHRVMPTHLIKENKLGGELKFAECPICHKWFGLEE